EVRTQKLLQFLQLSSNPMDAPFVKRDYLLREVAQGLDIDHEKVINDPREAGIQASMMAEYMKKMGIDPNQQKGQGSPPAPTGAEGGAVPTPDSPQSSAGGGGSNIGQPPQGGQAGGGQEGGMNG